VLAVAPGGMAGNLSRRGGKDEPALARINRGKTEHVAEKGAICLGVAAVDNRVHPYDHGRLQCSSDFQITAGSD